MKKGGKQLLNWRQYAEEPKMKLKLFLTAFLFILLSWNTYAMATCPYIYEIPRTGQAVFQKDCGMEIGQIIKFKYEIPNTDTSITIIELQLENYVKNGVVRNILPDKDKFILKLTNKLGNKSETLNLTEDKLYEDTLRGWKGFTGISLEFDAARSFAAQVKKLKINLDNARIDQLISQKDAGFLEGLMETGERLIDKIRPDYCQAVYDVPGTGHFKLQEDCYFNLGDNIRFKVKLSATESVELFELKLTNYAKDTKIYYWDDDIFTFTLTNLITGTEYKIVCNEDLETYKSLDKWGSISLYVDSTFGDETSKINILILDLDTAVLESIERKSPKFFEKVKKKTLDNRTKTFVENFEANMASKEDSEAIVEELENILSGEQPTTQAVPPATDAYPLAWKLEGATLQQLNKNKQRVSVINADTSEAVSAIKTINIYRDKKDNDVTAAFYLITFESMGQYHIKVDGTIKHTVAVEAIQMPGLLPYNSYTIRFADSAPYFVEDGKGFMVDDFSNIFGGAQAVETGYLMIALPPPAIRAQYEADKITMEKLAESMTVRDSSGNIVAAKGNNPVIIGQDPSGNEVFVIQKLKYGQTYTIIVDFDSNNYTAGTITINIGPKATEKDLVVGEYSE